MRADTIKYKNLDGIRIRDLRSTANRHRTSGRNEAVGEIATRDLFQLYGYQPRIITHARVEPHPAWNIARLKRETPANARELSPFSRTAPVVRINLYVALRNQAKEATPPPNARVAPRRAEFPVSGPVYAPMGMKLRGGGFVLSLYEFGLVMYSDKENESASRSTKTMREAKKKVDR